MAEIFFINGPIRKFVRQDCTCSHSYPEDRNQFKQHEDGVMKDNYTITILHEPDVCNVCGVPYKVWYDTSNIIKVTNIGDEIEKE